ncbi:uncharacterized protein LOC135691687 [Rhopilema esculentum]|uniref:uncharacterized protein LOC135691687 n=1 Tax=Rhopilema esculentum TaxID=499914 RepID=UPI0031E12BA1
MAFKLSIEAAEFVPGPKRNAPPQTDANHGGRSAFSVRPKRETPYPSIGMSHFEHPQTNMNPMGHSWNMSAPEFVPAYICPTLIRGCLPQNQTFGNQSKHHMLQDKQRPRDYMFESKRNEKFANGTASKGPRKNAKKQQKDEPAQPLESRNWRVVSSNNPNNTKPKAHGTNHGTVDKKNVSFSNAGLKSENTKAVQATSSSLDYSENFSNMHAKRREIGEGTSMRPEHSKSSQISSIKSVNKAEESGRVGMSWSKIVQSKPTSKQIDTKLSMDNKDRIAVATKTDARRQDGLIQGKNGVRFKDRGDHWSNKVASNVHSDIRGNYAKENHHYRPSEWRGQRRDIMNEGTRNQIRNSWGDDLEWRRDSAESKREVTKNRPTSYYDRSKAADRNWKEKKLLWKKTGMVTENYQYKFVTRKFSEEVKEKLLGNTREFFEHEYNDSHKSHANRTRGWYSMDWGLESQCKQAVDNKIHDDEILDDDKVASTWDACDGSKSAQSLTNRPIITPDKTCIGCGQTKPVPYNMAARQTTKNIEDEKYCSICLKKNSNYLSGNFKITGAEGRSFSDIANDDRRRVQIMNDKSQPAAISVRSNLRTGENGENQETKVRLNEKEILTDELKDLDACKEMHKSDTFANSRHEYLQDLEEDDSDDGWVTVEVKPKRKATREQIVDDNKHKSSPVKQRPSDKVDSSSMIKTTTGSESVGKGAKKKTGVKSSAEDNKQTQEKAKSNAKTKNRKKSSKRKVNTLYENDQKKIKEFKMRQMIEENLKLDLLEMTRTRRPNDAPATTEVEVGKKEEWPAIGNPNISSVNILSFSEALKKKAQPKPAPQVVQPRKAGMLVVDPSKLTPEQKIELKRKKMKEKRKVKKKERKERKRTEKEENTEIDTEKTVFENKSSFKLDLGDMFDMLLKSSAEKSQSSNAQTKSSRHVVFSAGVVSVASGLAKKNKPDGSKHESTRGRLSGNALDFNQHMKMSGKERETPKRKRPTLLKRVILAAREAKRKARIILFLTSYPTAREAMLVAFNESMTKGDYAFIICMKDVDEVKRKLKHQFKWYISHYTETLHTTRDVKKALDAALILAPKMPAVSYGAFVDRLRTTMGKAPFYSSAYIGKINGTHMDKSQSQPPPWGARAYDAVKLYALGLNRSLQQGNSIRNGKAVIDNIRSTTFKSILGHDIYVDENGQVELNYTVLDKRGDLIEQVGEFVLEHPPVTNSTKVKRKVKLVLKKEIQWPGLGKAPRDSPACGFDGEFCLPPPQKEDKKDHLFMAIAVALSIVAIVLFIIPVVMYRQYRLERELTSQLWKIDPNDLYVYDGRAPSCSSFGSITSNSWSIMEKGPREKFTTVAIYRGTFVAVKKINKRTVELSRNVLMELKQMRDIRHDNINMFIGACTEPGNVLIVTQYATKGSLQDVLENETIKLDNLFILSLLYDIVKGLLYLSSTEIKTHGNLKSSNCVIDSRWMLKLTDFGLYHFKVGQDDSEMSTREYYKRLLWCAPERLRSEPQSIQGNQKCDVYSFAIILQECHTREGAWSGTFLEPQDIIERVKFTECPPFRPPVPYLIEKVEGLRDLMKRCWCEEPDDRPSIVEIRKEIENMMAHNGLKRNIFDNMIYMMERYTENLEEVVECKTGELMEEKRKTEALLERMLPITVAKQLKKGKAVEAEHFSDVTIYFSDIVGFTSLCAECTPMQVVNILNDLYTLFDDVIKVYDVYKVETIGDAYMVASGLPIRNGQQHAKEIALMSLNILSEVKDFTIRHKPGYKLNLRVGVHTGPVVAGVVGTVMPRYCLFGDTVNTSSRMETTGVPLKIHISASTGKALLALGGFQLEERGEVFLKGKGSVTTYWLLDADESLKRTRGTEDDKPKCHNAKIGSQFSMALLRNSPSLRAKLLTSGLSGTPRGTPKDSVNNSPSILNCTTRKKKKMEFDTVVTAERVQLLNSSSPIGTNLENGETPVEEFSKC